LVSRGAFKWTLIYLRFYYELWEDFTAIEVDGDRRISETEFVNGKDLLIKDWKIKIDDPSAKFKQILTTYEAKENITFTQFCDWVIQERLQEFDDLHSHDDI
jgi:hypothetical protein